MSRKGITILLLALLICAMLAACAEPSSTPAPVSSPGPLSESASGSPAPASSSEPSSAPVSASEPEPEELPELTPVEPLDPDAPVPPPLPDYSGAEAIALKDAGLKASEVSMRRSNLIKGGAVVAVSFDHIKTDSDAMTIFEYTYEIDAKTGKVLASSVEEFVIGNAPVMAEDTGA